MKNVVWILLGMMPSYAVASDYCGQKIPNKHIRSDLGRVRVNDCGNATFWVKCGKKGKGQLVTGTSLDNTLIQSSLCGGDWLKDFLKTYCIFVKQSKSGNILLSSRKK